MPYEILREDRATFLARTTSDCGPALPDRRRIAAAAHLCNDVLRAVPIREWVFWLPYRMRDLLSDHAKRCSAVRRILVRVLLGWLAERAAAQGIAGSRWGTAVLARCFGGALLLNPPVQAILRTA